MSASHPLAVITGGAGFIGSHAVDAALAAGYRVHVIDNMTGGRLENLAAHHHNPDLRVDSRDIRQLAPDDALFRGAEIVLHFAGIGDIVPSIERPAEYMSVNVQGTVAVLEAARAAGVGKLVYAASSSCYGLATVPTDEDHPIDPCYPYALSKYQGEQACLHWHRVYGLPVNSIRIFNAYGTRSRTSGAYGAVFGVFLRQKLANHPFTVVGDGAQTRDFLYVSDVAAAFLAAARTDLVGHIWNLGASAPQSVNRLVELMGGGSVTHLPKRPGEPDCTWADTRRIRDDLGWAPLVSFEEGVAKVLADIDYWRDAPLWTPDRIAEATRTWFAMLSQES
ncbi:MAG: GDP-mannose 4,6-dehydratase [Azospirillaceae bacterium]|nr:GDP-mannose 4,6-dehydratase [Azospirillaceae bacterium]